MLNIIITGGTGLVGSMLSQMLEQKGYHVMHISRNPQKSVYKSFKIDTARAYLDTSFLQQADYIINLAGAGVADRRWTKACKQEIYDSRIQTTALIYKALKENPHHIKAVISASAIGIYGTFCPEPTAEDAPVADNFLAEVCRDWENETFKISNLGIRTAALRIGIVISNKGGFLKTVSLPAKYGLGSALGNGKMITSWIHIEDLCNMFIFAIENTHISGAYNAVAPNPETNKTLTKLICKYLKKPFILPPVPAFMLKLMFGEMADMILSSQHISAQKIQQSGFVFKYNNAPQAIQAALQGA